MQATVNVWICATLIWYQYLVNVTTVVDLNIVNPHSRILAIKHMSTISSRSY